MELIYFDRIAAIVPKQAVVVSFLSLSGYKRMGSNRLTIIAFSINYAVEDSTANINDPHASLKIYEDANTDSGNRIQVPPHLDPALYPCPNYANKGNVKRQFCGNCGSPILSKSPKYPGMSIFKAMLFEELAPPSKEVFTGSRVGFVKPIEGAEQA